MLMWASSTRAKAIWILLRALPIAALALLVSQTQAAASHPTGRLSKWGDADRDHLRNWTEVNRTRTNPRKADTDGDGLSDWTEVKRTGTNPRKADTDGDGISDSEENRVGSNSPGYPNIASKPIQAPPPPLSPGALSEELGLRPGEAGIEGAAGLLEGSPACTGVDVRPEYNLQTIINEHGEGTTFCLQGGTYTPMHAITSRNYDSFIGAERGVVIDGGDKVGSGLIGWGKTHGAHVVVENISFTEFTAFGLFLEQDSTINHVEATDNQIGVSVGTGSTVEHSYIHDNIQYGATGGPGSDITYENNDLYHNNTSDFCGGECSGNAGTSKFVGPEGGLENLVWRHNYVHANIGNGIWEDIGVTSSTIEYNLVTDNTKSGIFIEISKGAAIRHNVVENNDSDNVGETCGHGSQIMNNDSTDVEVYGNTVKASNGANGICAFDSAREAPISEVKDFYVHGNYIYLDKGAHTGLSGRKSSAEKEAENRFVMNQYHVPDADGKHWQSPESDHVTWSSWQKVGQDTGGSLLIWE